MESTPRLVVHLTVSEIRALIREELRDELSYDRSERPKTTISERVTLAEACGPELLNCSDRHARGLVKTRQLEAVQTGRKLMITRSSIDRYIKERTR